MEQEGGITDGNDARARILAMMDYLEDQMARGRKQGVDFSEVEELLMGARLMVDSGAYNDAEELISQCTEMASQRFTDFEKLNRSIREAEEAIERARDSGKDVAEAQRLLKVAHYHKKSGLYRMGIDYAKRAARQVEETSREIAWGSALPGDA